jgi:hypothetical protein
MAAIIQTGRVTRAVTLSTARASSRQQQTAMWTRLSVRTAALKAPPSGVRGDPIEISVAPAPESASSTKATPAIKINLIPDNGVWENGIPPVMGAHLMASGARLQVDANIITPEVVAP